MIIEATKNFPVMKRVLVTDGADYPDSYLEVVPAITRKTHSYFFPEGDLNLAGGVEFGRLQLPDSNFRLMGEVFESPGEAFDRRVQFIRISTIRAAHPGCRFLVVQDPANSKNRGLLALKDNRVVGLFEQTHQIARR